ncbi:MAG: hypothetical protein MI924_06260 [Chloroflexales bacterium]|nr:hypothetical protein [Chloroflexales bacterium]
MMRLLLKVRFVSIRRRQLAKPATPVEFQVLAAQLKAQSTQTGLEERGQLQSGERLHPAAAGADDLMSTGQAAGVGPVARLSVQAEQPASAAQPLHRAVDSWAAAVIPVRQLLRDGLGGEGALRGGDPVQHCIARRRRSQSRPAHRRLHGCTPVGCGTVLEQVGRVVWTAHRLLRHVS